MTTSQPASQSAPATEQVAVGLLCAAAVVGPLDHARARPAAGWCICKLVDVDAAPLATYACFAAH